MKKASNKKEEISDLQIIAGSAVVMMFPVLLSIICAVF